MAIFEWICQDCSIYWERDLPVGKAPDRTRCPKCKKLSDRYFANQGLNVKWGDDKDFHTVRRRNKKHAEDGFDKTAGDRFLNQSIETTKNAMNDESYRYKGMNLDWDKLAKDRGVKKVTDAEASKKVESAKKMTIDAYDKANKMGYKDIGSTKLDITKPKKQS
tara:strand:+ start:1134 stop:1622 length:489 start_codon:yes stop_codon:yes gene_type:complete